MVTCNIVTGIFRKTIWRAFAVVVVAESVQYHIDHQLYYFLLTMPRNKNRIYMAFYSRSKPDDYHMAVLVSPKNPAPNDTNTWRLHVMNKPNPSRLTQQEWKYEPLEVIGRTGRLLALGLLGKTDKSGKEVSEMLGAVEVVQDDIGWLCVYAEL